jgi:aminopeptidase-like protein
VNKFINEIDALLKKLFPICRSITGEGNRQTLKILKKIIPIKIKEYSSGDKIYDWIIPKEWHIRDAWIKDDSGNKLIDFKDSNIHVVSYSTPIRKKIHFSELKKHLHYLPHLPDAVPYCTSYYKEDWGFCISYNDLNDKFNDEKEYEVFIDSELKNGKLSIGEIIIKGKSKLEHLISTYICHPSLANDNLSGVILAALLAKKLREKNLNFSYRVIFVPETIGAVTYCSKNESIMKKIDAGFVITSVGGPGKFGYKQSFEKTHHLNSMVEDVFREKNLEYHTYPFCPYGSDERQYSSQGFRINTVSITKDKYYEYDFYHTSLDNLDFVKSENILKSLEVYEEVIEKLDKNLTFKNVNPYCEVFLNKHKFYPTTGARFNPNNDPSDEQQMILWLLFLCDGKKSLHAISKDIGHSFEALYDLAIRLEEKCLLKRID